MPKTKGPTTEETGLEDVPESLWDELEEMLAEYAQQQVKDLIRFVLIAVSMGGMPNTQHGLKWLLRKAAKFVAHHGRPMPSSVRATLDEDGS